MAKNEVYEDGDSIPIAVPATVVSGDPVVVGELVGVAITSRDAAGLVSLRRKGVFSLTVTGAITLGAPVYAVVSGGLVTSLTATATSNTRFGVALAAQAATGLIPVLIGYP
jgi:predicted RecA/RadA family phage recombinase